MVKTRKSAPTAAMDAATTCCTCSSVLQSPEKICQNCASRQEKMNAPDAPKTDQEIMSLLREPKARNRARLVQNWAQTWHRKNCALVKEVKTLQMSSKVMRRQLDHKEKEIAALKAQQAPAEKVKLGHLHCKKAGGFKNKTIKKRQIKTIRKVSIRPPG